MSASARTGREALLDAVGTVLARAGIGGLSLRQVALAAGVSHGAPGALFGDRAGMLTAYAARGFLRLGLAMERAATAARDGREALAATGRGYVAFAREEPACFALMFRPELINFDAPDLRAARERAYSPLKAAISRSVVEGLLPASRADEVSYGAWAIVHGLAGLLSGGLRTNRFANMDEEAVVDILTAMYAGAMMPKHPD